MLDGLLGRGFASKCKPLIKLIKNRIDLIKRKRKATQKFLKKDIADLLANGLDINAYGRADGLLAELNVSYCYNFVEQCCNFVLKSLSLMQRWSTCPEDCREVVSSMMFAAARFSDLPELRDLRNIFHERYGNSLEHFENKEFVEKLSPKSATMDQKVQLMQDIASEFSINWDSKAFQQRMSKPFASVQDQPKNYGSCNVSNDKYKSINAKDILLNEDKHGVSYKDRIDSSDGHRSRNDKEDNASDRVEHIFQPRLVPSSDRFKPFNGTEESMLKMDDREISLHGKQEIMGDKHEAWNGKKDVVLNTVRGSRSTHEKRMETIEGTSKPHGGRENSVPQREKPFMSPSYMGQHVKSDGKDLLDSLSCGVQYSNTNLRKGREEEVTKLEAYYESALPPPYVKSKDSTVKSRENKHGANLGYSHLGSNGNGVPIDPSEHIRTNSADRSEKMKIQLGSDPREHEKGVVGNTRVDSHDDENCRRNKYDGVGNPIPKPRSVRRRHHKSATGHDDVGNVGDADVVKRKSRSRRRDDSRRGLQILFDDEHCENDEEERKMDKLLMYYSMKPSTCEPGLLEKKSKSRHAHHVVSSRGEAPQTPNRDVPDEMSQIVPPPARSISLPRGQKTPKTAKVFSRAASFQPDRSNEARHVHPKLPDYDNLAAHFASLKGR